jgi:asparagine synthase (glutamine-hydrolysing)
MCGIFGVCGELADRPDSLGVLRTMGKALIHRGPDDQGTHMERGVGIGMRRLSIIDLKTGHQPSPTRMVPSGRSSTGKSTTIAN